MIKTKIFLFWLGEKNNRILKKANDIKKMGFDVEIGPSKKEHEFLLKKSFYYAYSYNVLKRYAFCSDVWRFYKLSIEKGIYIDFSTIIGKDFKKLIQKIENKEVAAFKGSPYLIESGVIWSGIKNNSFFKKTYDFYTTKNADPSIVMFSSSIFTYMIWKETKFSISFNSYENKKFGLYPLSDIRNKNTLWKTSVGSWGRNGGKINNYFDEIGKNDGWKKHEENYKNEIIDQDWKKYFEILQKYGPYVPSTWMIRREYDTTTSKARLKELKNAYKQIKYRKGINQWLIWSKLYRLFTGKKANY